MATNPLPRSRPGLAEGCEGPLTAAPSLSQGSPQTLGHQGIPQEPLLFVQVKAIRAELGAGWITALPPPPLEQGLVPVLLSIVHLGFPPNPPHANVRGNKTQAQLSSARCLQA